MPVDSDWSQDEAASDDSSDEHRPTTPRSKAGSTTPSTIATRGSPGKLCGKLGGQTAPSQAGKVGGPVGKAIPVDKQCFVAGCGLKKLANKKLKGLRPCADPFGASLNCGSSISDVRTCGAAQIPLPI